MITTDKKARKAIPIATGFVDYFPKAIAAVAAASKVGNDQHHPDSPLHWDRSKSGDESDALMRHFLERGTNDTDGVRHSAKVAWRAMALLEKEIELEEEAQRKLDALSINDKVCIQSDCTSIVTSSSSGLCFHCWKAINL